MTENDPASGKRSVSPEWIEIYKERYETFRHLDRLRWQSPMIALVGGSALLGLTKAEQFIYPPFWSFIIFAILCFLSAFLIFQIRKGVRKNDEALTEAAREIGDLRIPGSTNSRGASWWFMLFLIILGLASSVFAVALSTGYVENSAVALNKTAKTTADLRY
jgi:F0F1-type ATP synthase assembly protein I